jgi:hypothetical protein
MVISFPRGHSRQLLVMRYSIRAVDYLLETSTVLLALRDAADPAHLLPTKTLIAVQSQFKLVLCFLQVSWTGNNVVWF